MKKNLLISAIIISFTLMLSACDGKNKTDEIATSMDATVETEELETTEVTTSSTEETKPSTEETKPSTEETKPSTEQPTNPQPTQPTNPQPTEPAQPAHTHNFTGGDCSNPSTCSCGATGSYGSHNWTTRTWTEEIVHEGETVTTYQPGARCGECGFTGTVLEVDAHQDTTGCMGYTGYEIPITTTTAPWTETVTHSETTCSICGARQ